MAPFHTCPYLSLILNVWFYCNSVRLLWPYKPVLINVLSSLILFSEYSFLEDINVLIFSAKF